jgi:formiminotetrahydrofolate cyclodeaminase
VPWQPVDAWLSDLASGSPTPGGGGAAALSAATGAALVSMVCELTVGRPRYAEHEQRLREILAEASGLRERALELAGADARAFDTVIAAYRLPRDSEDAKRERESAIQAALASAAVVPVHVAEVAARVIGLAGELPGRCNPSVLSDVAVAAVTARAALDSAAINVEVNLASMHDAERRASLAGQLAAHAGAAAAAERIAAEVRTRISA